MKRINVQSFGLCGDGRSSNSEPLRTLLDKIQDDTVLFFPKGTYYFSESVDIKDKKKLSIIGEDATLMTNFEPCGDPKLINDLFNFYNCEDIVISDVVITTNKNIGWSGEVIAVNSEEKYYDVKIYDEFEVTGFEHPVAINTCDSDGTPDYIFGNDVWRGEEIVMTENGEKKRYGGHEYEVVGDHICRFKAGDSQSLLKLRVGEKVCYRFIIYGNRVFGFSGTKRVLIKNVDVYRASSMVIVIGAGSEDFTLDHFTVKVAPGSRELYATNADGIHINGLGGYLRIKHCEFVGLGDDALNVHSFPGVISHIIENNKFEIVQPLFNDYKPPVYGKLPAVWAKSGDVLEAYDRDTFEFKGNMIVGNFEDGILTVTEVDGEISENNILINTSFCPSVHISDCTIKNTRARGFLIRTRNVLIENCYIYGMSLPAILITPDIVVWHEVGNSKNVTIKNNVFEKCAIIKSPANRGAIAVKSCDDDINNINYPSYVHSGIHIIGNRFTDIGNSAIYVSASNDVEITENKFENCCSKRYSSTEYGIRHDIVTENCGCVKVANNSTTQNEKRIFWAKKCKEVSAE